MAEPKKVQGGNQAKKKPPTSEEIGKQAAAKIFDKLKKEVAAPKLKPEELGPMAKELMSGLALVLAKQVKKGVLADAVIATASAQLKKLHQLDAYVRQPPKDLKAENALLDNRTFKIKETEQKGVYALTGSAAGGGHVLQQIFAALKEFGVSVDGFPERIAELLDGAGGARKSLADPQTWTTIVGEMALAAMRSPISAAPKPAVNGADKTAADVAKTKNYPKDLGAVPNGDLGLEKTATQTSGTGSRTNGVAVRTALLKSLNEQGLTVDKVAGDVLAAVIKEFKATPDKDKKRAILNELKQILTDKSSPSGKADPFKLAMRAFDALAKASPKKDQEMLGELSGWIKEALTAKPGATVDTEQQLMFTAMAASVLSDTVALKLGKKVKSFNAGELASSLATALDTLVNPPDAKAADASNKAAPTPKADPPSVPPDGSSPYASDRPDIPQPLKDAALRLLVEHKMPADHPRSKEAMNALAEVLMHCGRDRGGDISGTDFVVRINEWIMAHGGDKQRSEACIAVVQKASQALDQHESSYQAAKVEYKRLQAEQSSSTDPQTTGRLEKELERLEVEIGKLEGSLRSAAEATTKDLIALQRDGLRGLAQIVCSGKLDGPQGAQTQTTSGNGGGNNSGGGNNVDGNGGGKKPPNNGNGSPNYFHRDEPSPHGGIPGFNAGGRPSDYGNNKDLTVQQQRALKCGEILADGSLTIEDKIFLFMMWFTAFTDQEREKKLEELVQMDREAARIQKAKDDKLRDITSLREARKNDQGKLDQAQTELRKVEKGGTAGDTPEVQKAKAAVATAQTELDNRDTAIRTAEAEHSQLKVENDQAPKSREVLFMEIERLSQLRDKIMNMARSILESSNRNVEKIFR